MKKALVIANMLFASAAVWGMTPNNPNGNVSNAENLGNAGNLGNTENLGNTGNFSQVREDREKEDQEAKRRKISGFQSNVQNNVQNGASENIYVPPPIFIYDVRWDGSRFAKTQQPRLITYLQFKHFTLILAQSSRSYCDFLRKSVDSFYGNEYQLKYIQTHQASDIINEFTSGDRKTLEEFSRQNPLLAAFIHQRFTCMGDDIHFRQGDVSLLELGGTFSSLKEVKISADQVKRLSLESLNLPVLNHLNIKIPPECFNKANDLISKVSSTLKDLIIELADDNSESETESESIKNNSERSVLPSNMPLIPESVWLCKNLDSLDLKIFHSGFTSLPQEIGNLKKLKMLSLEDNTYLKTLPPEIGKLKNLKSLYVDFTNIRSLPHEIWNLTKLKNIYLDDRFSARRFNDIDDIVDMEDDEIMWETRNLDMSNAGITDLSEFPIDIIKFENTKKINLSGNKYFDSIDKIPNLVFGLPRLKSVILSANLSAIPEIESIQDSIHADGFNIRYKNSEKAGQIIVLARENDGKYRIEYTSDALTQIRSGRIREINKKIKKTREEINDNVLDYLFVYKNRFGMDNNSLKKLIKGYLSKNREIEKKVDSLQNMIGKLISAEELDTSSESESDSDSDSESDSFSDFESDSD